MSETIIILIIVLAIAVLIVVLYNQLVKLRQLTDNGWSDIDVQLKRRSDLIPRLVSTVKGYAKHERDLFADITEKRTLAIAAGSDPAKRGAAESALSLPVTRMLAVAEDYPDLKANQNFLDLQNELSETENKIEMARRFYNGAVRGLNTKVQTIPANLVAGLFGFRLREYFNIETSDAANPAVDFGA